MPPTSLVNLSSLIDDAKCYALVRQQRWPDGVRCPACGGATVIRHGRDDTQDQRQRYRCKDCRARFSVWRAGRRHELAGLIVQDLLRQDEAWLVDEALEQSAPEAMTMAMRLCTPDAFAMTSGIIVPVDREVMEEVLDEVLPRVRGEPDQVANDRRFATPVYRMAVAEGLMRRVSFEEAQPPT